MRTEKCPRRVENEGLEMERFLKTLPGGSAVAWESSGNWYWLVQATEQAGLEPRLEHALEAKKRMPGRHKTDHLDAKGLALLLRNGSLPELWIRRPSKREGSKTWWMRYRDKDGIRQRESTLTEDWDEAQKRLRERLQARDNNGARAAPRTGSHLWRTVGLLS